MTGISSTHWQVENRLYHLRGDAKELAALFKAHGAYGPEFLESLKESVAQLQKIIDAHVLQPVQTRLQADQGRSAVAVAMPEEQAAGRLRVRDTADMG